MAQIFVINGPDKGRSFDFKENTVFLGRGIENDVQMTDKSVSRRHLKIEKKGDRYSITDLKSKNGTFIDGMRISAEKEYEVKEGAPVAVGKIFVSIGRSYPNDMLSILDSIDVFKELDQDSSVVTDRPLTPKKNMELIYKVSNVLMQSLNIHQVLEKMLGYVMDLLQRIDRGVVILTDRGTGNISDVISIQKTHQQTDREPYSRTIVEKVLKEGKPISMLDTLQEDQVNISESIRELQIRSVMCVPLISKSEIRGVIYVDSVKKPHGFRKEDLDLLTALSKPAALAIENSLIGRGPDKLEANRTPGK